VNELKYPDWQTYHGGYDTYYTREDPHRLVALPELRQLEAEGKIGKLADFILTWSSLVARWLGCIKLAQNIIPIIQEEKIDAVVHVAT
jgi:glycine reductase